MNIAPTTNPTRNPFLFLRRLSSVSFSITISSSVSVSCQSDRVSYESEPYLLVISHYTYYSKLYVFCNPLCECLLSACFAIRYLWGSLVISRWVSSLSSMRLPEAWVDKCVVFEKKTTGLIRNTLCSRK